MIASTELKNKFQNITRLAFIGAAIGMVATIILSFKNLDGFYQNYLTAYLFWLGITLGAFPLIMIQNLTDGNWGYPIRRLLECMTYNIPLLFVLGFPILIGLSDIYPWADPSVLATDHIVQKKAPYLNVSGFVIRYGVYFVMWMALAFLLNKLSLAQNREPNVRKHNQRVQAISGVGMVVIALSGTFAITDLSMSLEPHWFSTIYGFLFLVGFTIEALTFSVITVLKKRAFKPFKDVITSDRIRDFALLLFATGMLWAYLAVSQFIIIWNGNLQEEAPWYQYRFGGNWVWFLYIVIAVQLILPFLAFMFTPIKRSAKWVIGIASAIFFVRYIELYWLTQPAFHHEFHIEPLSFVLPVTMGCLWLWFLCRSLVKTDLTLDYDPILAKH